MKKRKPMTQSDFSSLCECVAKTGNSSHCMRVQERQLDDLYRYLKKYPEEKSKLTIARSMFHDELSSRIREIAFAGVPCLRKGERGKIITDENGNPVVDRIPNPQLIAAILRDTSNRLTKMEQSDEVRQSGFQSENKASFMEKEIVSDPPPGIRPLRKKTQKS